MKNRYRSLVIGLLINFFASGQCTRPHRKHSDIHVYRCNYYQEDIYRAYCKKPHCYGCTERCKECFFCGCPIDQHTKRISSDVVYKKKNRA